MKRVYIEKVNFNQTKLPLIKRVVFFKKVFVISKICRGLFNKVGLDIRP